MVRFQPDPPGIKLSLMMVISSGGLAQLGEHLLCKQGVVGSIPSSSTKVCGNQEAEESIVDTVFCSDRLVMSFSSLTKWKKVSKSFWLNVVFKTRGERPGRWL